MDCLLISPPIFYNDDDNIWTEISSNFPPMGLAYIAGYVRSLGFSVEIIDCNIEATSVDTFAGFMDGFSQKHEGIRVIGLTAMTCTIKKAHRIAEICRKYYPCATIVFGGVHPTFLPEEVLADRNVDVVVIGEGEMTFAELLSGRRFSEIDGLAYRVDNGDPSGILLTPPRKRIADLDMIPMPAYDLLPVLKYHPAKGSYKRLPAMSMITSRGCPGKCTFCNKTLGDQLVFKSAEKIFEEIVCLHKNYGIKQVMFYDDTFTVFRKNVFELCDLLIRNKIDITWTCFARVDFVDLEILTKMKAAGCHQIMFGVENVDERVLGNVNKKINSSQVECSVKFAKMAGIECRLAFMVGNPGDTREIIVKNIDFAININADLLIINITTPFPGTEMFAWARERNFITTYNWDDYTLAKPIMRLENLAVDDIKELYILMYRKFYFRPSYILNRIMKIRSKGDLLILLKGGKALLAFLGGRKASVRV